MRKEIHARTLLLSVLFAGVLFLAGCSDDQVEQQVRVKRLYKVEKEGSVSRYTEFRIYYDAEFRISKISQQVRREEEGKSEVDSYVDYYYVYDRDTLYLRYGGTMGGSHGPSAYGGEYRMPLDEDGRIRYRTDSPEAEVWAAGYEGGELVELGRYRLSDSSFVSSLSFCWEDGNLDWMQVEGNRIDFEYGEAPLANRMNLDFLQFFLETTYMGNVPLWSIGLMGDNDDDMPSRVVMDATGSQIVFSYQTDGRNVVSISMHSVQTRNDEVWQVEYE